jgi:hypothetical protein
VAQVPPPQSFPVSAPFFTPSVQVGTWQTLPMHTPEAQSAPTPHGPSSGQPAHDPPQSTPVSNPFFAWSVQLGAWQKPSVQMPDAQSDPVLHW